VATGTYTVASLTEDADEEDEDGDEKPDEREPCLA